MMRAGRALSRFAGRQHSHDVFNILSEEAEVSRQIGAVGLTPIPTAAAKVTNIRERAVAANAPATIGVPCKYLSPLLAELLRRSPASSDLPKSKEGQHGQYDNNQTDEINQTVHRTLQCSLRCFNHAGRQRFRCHTTARLSRADCRSGQDEPFGPAGVAHRTQTCRLIKLTRPRNHSHQTGVRNRMDRSALPFRTGCPISANGGLPCATTAFMPLPLAPPKLEKPSCQPALSMVGLSDLRHPQNWVSRSAFFRGQNWRLKEMSDIAGPGSSPMRWGLTLLSFARQRLKCRCSTTMRSHFPMAAPSWSTHW